MKVLLERMRITGRVGHPLLPFLLGLMTILQPQTTTASGVLNIRIIGFSNPTGRSFDGICCDPSPLDQMGECSDQCDYVMRLVVSGLGRANDHVFLFHRPIKYDSNDIAFETGDNNMVLSILFDRWPMDGHVKMNAFFYDYDELDHTTTLVDWFEADLHRKLADQEAAHNEEIFQPETAMGTRQANKTKLLFEWAATCHESGKCLHFSSTKNLVFEETKLTEAPTTSTLHSVEKTIAKHEKDSEVDHPPKNALYSAATIRDRVYSQGFSLADQHNKYPLHEINTKRAKKKHDLKDVRANFFTTTRININPDQDSTDVNLQTHQTQGRMTSLPVIFNVNAKQGKTVSRYHNLLSSAVGLENTNKTRERQKFSSKENPTTNSSPNLSREIAPRTKHKLKQATLRRKKYRLTAEESSAKISRPVKSSSKGDMPQQNRSVGHHRHTNDLEIGSRPKTRTELPKGKVSKGKGGLKIVHTRNIYENVTITPKSEVKTTKSLAPSLSKENNKEQVAVIYRGSYNGTHITKSTIKPEKKRPVLNRYSKFDIGPVAKVPEEASSYQRLRRNQNPRKSYYPKAKCLKVKMCPKNFESNKSISRLSRPQSDSREQSKWNAMFHLKKQYLTTPETHSMIPVGYRTHPSLAWQATQKFGNYEYKFSQPHTRSTGDSMTSPTVKPVTNSANNLKQIDHVTKYSTSFLKKLGWLTPKLTTKPLNITSPTTTERGMIDELLDPQDIAVIEPLTRDVTSEPDPYSKRLNNPSTRISIRSKPSSRKHVKVRRYRIDFTRPLRGIPTETSSITKNSAFNAFIPSTVPVLMKGNLLHEPFTAFEPDVNGNFSGKPNYIKPTTLMKNHMPLVSPKTTALEKFTLSTINPLDEVEKKQLPKTTRVVPESKHVADIFSTTKMIIGPMMIDGVVDEVNTKQVHSDENTPNRNFLRHYHRNLGARQRVSGQDGKHRIEVSVHQYEWLGKHLFWPTGMHTKSTVLAFDHTAVPPNKRKPQWFAYPDGMAKGVRGHRKPNYWTGNKKFAFFSKSLFNNLPLTQGPPSPNRSNSKTVKSSLTTVSTTFESVGLTKKTDSFDQSYYTTASATNLPSANSTIRKENIAKIGENYTNLKNADQYALGSKILGSAYSVSPTSQNEIYPTSPTWLPPVISKASSPMTSRIGLVNTRKSVHSNYRPMYTTTQSTQPDVSGVSQQAQLPDLVGYENKKRMLDVSTFITAKHSVTPKESSQRRTLIDLTNRPEESLEGFKVGEHKGGSKKPDFKARLNYSKIFKGVKTVRAKEIRPYISITRTKNTSHVNDRLKKKGNPGYADTVNEITRAKNEITRSSIYLPSKKVKTSELHKTMSNSVSTLHSLDDKALQRIRDTIGVSVLKETRQKESNENGVRPEQKTNFSKFPDPTYLSSANFQQTLAAVDEGNKTRAFISTFSPAHSTLNEPYGTKIEDSNKTEEVTPVNLHKKKVAMPTRMHTSKASDENGSELTNFNMSATATSADNDSQITVKKKFVVAKNIKKGEKNDSVTDLISEDLKEKSLLNSLKQKYEREYTVKGFAKNESTTTFMASFTAPRRVNIGLKGVITNKAGSNLNYTHTNVVASNGWSSSSTLSSLQLTALPNETKQDIKVVAEVQDVRIVPFIGNASAMQQSNVVSPMRPLLDNNISYTDIITNNISTDHTRQSVKFSSTVPLVDQQLRNLTSDIASSNSTEKSDLVPFTEKNTAHISLLSPPKPTSLYSLFDYRDNQGFKVNSIGQERSTFTLSFSENSPKTKHVEKHDTQDSSSHKNHPQLQMELPQDGFILHDYISPTARQFFTSRDLQNLQPAPHDIDHNSPNDGYHFGSQPALDIPHSALYDPEFFGQVDSEEVPIYLEIDNSSAPLPSSVKRYGSPLPSIDDVGVALTRHWPAVLGVAVGTMFLLTALITSILCRQRRLLIQRSRWVDSPQHLNQPPSACSDTGTCSAASIRSDTSRSTAPLE